MAHNPSTLVALIDALKKRNTNAWLENSNKTERFKRRSETLLHSASTSMPKITNIGLFSLCFLIDKTFMHNTNI